MSESARDGAAVSERVAVAFSKLTESAANINKISNQLAKQVAELEGCLKRIDVRVACWTTLDKQEEQYESWSTSVGYARLKGEWRIAIETRHARDWTDQDDLEQWAFADAPRHLQAKAIEKLADLVEAMVSATNAAADRLEKKLAPAETLVTAVKAAMPKGSAGRR